MKASKGGKKKICRCIIRGIVQLGVVSKNSTILIHPFEYEKFLRQFKYCPICGKKIKL